MTRFSLATFVRGTAALTVVAALSGAFAGAGAAAGATYAALGDSYSSGVGTGSYTLDSACKRSVYAYPYLWTQKHAGTRCPSPHAPVRRRPTCSRRRSRR